MIGWLYRLIIGRFSSCNHIWEIIESGPYEGKDYDGRVIKRATNYVQRCTKCGEMKRKIL